VSIPSPENQPARTRLLSEARENDFRARLAARDERALAELVDLAAPWLLGVAEAMLQDPEEAEEVVLETFRVAWDRVPDQGEGPLGLMPWLLQIVRNRAIDRLRARRRRLRLLGKWSLDARTTSPPVEPNEAALPGWHVHTQVHQALAALPAEQLEAVQLAYFEGRTHGEIADRLGLPLGTVKTRLRLGLNRLRTGLASLTDWVV
jgi:RNA polymerase sigma-70 factor (ECF subfamily)